MATSYRTQVDLNNNELLNAVFENVASTPSTGTAGRIVYVTADNKLYYYNGSAYIALTTSESGEYQLLSQKDQASGYAGLDASGKIAIGEIPTGNDSDTVPLLKGTIGDGYSLVYSASSGGFVPFSVAGIYTFKGTATSAELDTYSASAASGDVYSLSDQKTYNNATYAAGTNWVWDASDSQWEPLTGIMDLSGYQTVSNMVSDMTTTSANTYPSTVAVAAAIATATATITAAVEGKVDKLEDGPDAGTYTKVTVNAEGQVTEGANLEASDIPDLSATYQRVSEKAQASGYASLDESTKVPIAQIPTGVTQNTVPVISAEAAGTAGQVLALNAAGTGFEYATIPTETFLTKYTGTITGGSTSNPATFSHGLGDLPASVTIFDADGNIVYADVQATTTQVTVTMTPAPSAGESFTVQIVG